MGPHRPPGCTGHKVIAAWASVFLALASAGCGDGERGQVIETAPVDDATSAAERPGNTATIPATPSTTVESRPAAPPTTTAPSVVTDPDPLPEACTEQDPGALQRAVDEGHQRWRADPVAVHSCVAGAFDWAAPTVEELAPDTYRATDSDSGDSVIVSVTRPFAEATIWVIESDAR